MVNQFVFAGCFGVAVNINHVFTTAAYPANMCSVVGSKSDNFIIIQSYRIDVLFQRALFCCFENNFILSVISHKFSNYPVAFGQLSNQFSISIIKVKMIVPITFTYPNKLIRIVWIEIKRMLRLNIF